MDADQPEVVTLLFTDVQGSTRLLRSLGDEAYRQVRASLSGLLRSIVQRHRGRVIDTQGDGVFAAFEGNALDAVAAAIEGQRVLGARNWPGGQVVQVRIGVHTGRLRRRSKAPSGGYVGLDVHHAARLCEAGHGGQVLVSETTRLQVAERLPTGLAMRPLGVYQLRDLSGPEPIHQVVAPGLASEFPPLRALDVRLIHLPTPRTPLVGRDQDVARLRDALCEPGPGLITLSGPGGTGKTRLAIAAASAVGGAFKDGICFVALAPISDPDLVVPTIVRRLGLQELGRIPLEEILLSHLRERRLLLVLDNFEHLLPMALVVAALLSECRHLKILVTSRAALRVQGEREHVVAPLGFPPPGSAPSYHDAGRYPAMALFADRAAAASGAFEITPANFSAVAALCARLDGLPLAIELAAARARILTPREMLARLQEDTGHARLDFLASGPRDAPARHRTLRDAIGWSYGLLGPDCQAMFRLLSVFVGGFTLESAAGLAAAVPGPMRQDPDGEPRRPDRSSLLAVVEVLAENNLLHRVERPGTEARFSMLETIREYGLEWLAAAGELRAAQSRHAAHFLAVAQAGEAEVRSERQTEWLGRLDDDHANFRAALAWSFALPGGDARTGAQLASALWVFWYRRAYMREGSRWTQQAYAACADAAPPLKAKLLTARGSLVRMLGDFGQAEALLEAAERLWRGLDDREGLAWALSHLGLTKQWLHQADEGFRLLQESLTIRLEAGEKLGIARSLFNLACGEDFRGHYASAADLFERAYQVQRQIGDTWGMGRVLGCLAKVVLRSGDHHRAERLCREALGLCEKVADKWGIGCAQAALAGVAWARGDLDRAADLLTQGMLTFRDVGARDRAAECLQELASLFRQRGAVERSVRLTASVESDQRRSNMALWPAVQALRDEDMASARASLSDDAFEQVWAEGMSIDLEQAMDDAVRQGGDAPFSPR